MVEKALFTIFFIWNDDGCLFLGLFISLGSLILLCLGSLDLVLGVLVVVLSLVEGLLGIRLGLDSVIECFLGIGNWVRFFNFFLVILIIIRLIVISRFKLLGECSLGGFCLGILERLLFLSNSLVGSLQCFRSFIQSRLSLLFTRQGCLNTLFGGVKSLLELLGGISSFSKSFVLLLLRLLNGIFLNGVGMVGSIGLSRLSLFLSLLLSLGQFTVGFV